MMHNAVTMARAVRSLRDKGWRVVIVHGNGPQVGNLAVQQNAASAVVPAQPLASLVAMTQGQMGSLVCLALREVYGADSPSVVSVVTHVDVDPVDPAFSRPTKPVGPFYDRATADRLAREHGWTVVEDSGRGYRRTVPSPRPRRVVEAGAIRDLLDAGHVVVAAGGGGVPVAQIDGHGSSIDAVIDKDLAAAMVATEIGAASLVLVTGVDAVMVDFGTPTQRPITVADCDEMRAYLAAGQFPEGSMGPKVRASLEFVEAGGRCAVITSPELVGQALTPACTAGTRIVSRVAGRGAA